MIQISESFRFTGETKYAFTLDVKSPSEEAERWPVSSCIATPQNRSSLEQVSTLSRAQVFQVTMSERSTNQPTIPLALTYDHLNVKIKRIMTANYKVLNDDPDTGNIFEPVRILCSYRHVISLRNSLVRTSCGSCFVPTSDCGTYPCERPRCKTCAHTNGSSVIDTPDGHINIHHRYTCTTANLVYLIQ